jgi:UDP-N-acetylglucosamine 2-epimerase
VATVIGARPQFIKAAPLTAALREAGISELVVHTGQHYDYQMSQIFFDELGIRAPDVNLEVGSGPHGRQTGEIMARLEELLVAEKPDRVIVFGDTNSTLAGAITAAKLGIPVSHVEAGLRSFNRKMPEEHNRVLADHCSDLLFCPTQTAVENLTGEGITKGVYLVGDPMCDSIRLFSPLAAQKSRILDTLGLAAGQYIVLTLHRPYNVDNPASLTAILLAITELKEPVIFPVHPRTRSRIDALSPSVMRSLDQSRLRLVEPLGYLDMLKLQQGARIIMTDSGGLQKEAYMLGVPCITLRPETEWVETVKSGWNVLTGDNGEAIARAATSPIPVDRPRPPLFGDGYASQQIVQYLQ